MALITSELSVAHYELEPYSIRSSALSCQNTGNCNWPVVGYLSLGVYIYMGIQGPREWAIVILAMAILLISQNIEACGDNVTPDATPDISWPENLI